MWCLHGKKPQGFLSYLLSIFQPLISPSHLSFSSPSLSLSPFLLLSLSLSQTHTYTKSLTILQSLALSLSHIHPISSLSLSLSFSSSFYPSLSLSPLSISPSLCSLVILSFVFFSPPLNFPLLLHILVFNTLTSVSLSHLNWIQS